MATIPKGLVSLGSRDYGEYLDHQVDRVPLDFGAAAYYELRYRMELAARLREFGYVYPGMSVLCLAARLGAEVRAFIDCGCFAVGIDLNPGEDNEYVVRGDFQRIQYAAGSVDVIFTNSADHVFRLDLFISEICRVLKPDGVLIMDIVKGTGDGVEPDQYVSLFWKKIDDLLAPFLAASFYLVGRADFDWPWPGQHVVLKR